MSWRRRASGWLRRHRQWLVIGAVHLGLAIVFMAPALHHLTTAIYGPATQDQVGYGGNGIPDEDALQNVWFMGWTPFALLHLHDPLFSHYINAPYGANLMWDALTPLQAAVFTPLTLWLGPVASANILVTVAIATCGVVTTVCARRFMAHPFATTTAGVCFQLSSYIAAQAEGHWIVVLGAAFVPLILVLVVDGLHGRTSILRTGILLGITTAALYYTWAETLVITALVAGIGLGVAGMLAPRRALASAWRAARFGAVGLAVGLVLAAPGLAMQFFGPLHIIASQIRPPDHWVIDLQNIVVPTSQQLLAPARAVALSHGWTGDSPEWGGYLGIPLILVVLGAVVVLRRQRAVWWLAIMLVIVEALSLGSVVHFGGANVAGWTPWALLAHVPVLGDALAARFAIFSALASALLLGIATDRLLAHRHRATALAAVMLVLVAIVPRPLPTQPIAIPAFFTSADVQRIPADSVALVAPYPNPIDAVAMTWQAAAGMRFKMVGGYVDLPTADGMGFSEFPLDTTTRYDIGTAADGGGASLSEAQIDGMRAELTAWQVHTVIVGPISNRDDVIAMLTRVLQRPPEELDGVAVWWNT